MRMQQIQQFLDSGLSATRWMKLNHMSSATFYLWFNKFREEDPERFGTKRQASSEWIELSRSEMKRDTALTRPACETTTTAATVGQQIASSQSTIRLTVNGIAVDIPFAGEDTVAMVLRAVMSL